MKHKFMKIFRSNDKITTSFYHKKYAVKKKNFIFKNISCYTQQHFQTKHKPKSLGSYNKKYNGKI